MDPTKVASVEEDIVTKEFLKEQSGANDSVRDSLDDVEADPAGKRRGNIGASWRRFLTNPLRRQPPPIPTKRENSREKTSSWFSQLTFIWMNSIMMTGYNRVLDIMDIPLLPDSRRVGANKDKLAAQFRLRMARGDKNALLFSLNHVFFREFWFGGLCNLTANMTMSLSPLMLKHIILYASEAYYGESNSVGAGIGLAFGIVAMQMFASLCIVQFIYRGMVVGGMIRASLISMIYAKSQVISSRAKAGGASTASGTVHETDTKSKRKGHNDAPGWSNGKVVNLMGTDSYRIDQAASWCHIIWVTPIQILVIVVQLVVNIGPSGLAGFGLLLLATPLLTWTVKILARRRGQMSKITDERISLTQEILQGLRFVKYFTWEASFLEQLQKLRTREIRAVQFLLGVRSAVNAVGMSLPVFASILSFVAYSLSHNKLEPASIFASLALFNGLRMPLQMLPMVISQSIDAHVSLGRIQDYLLAEEEEEKRQIDDDLKEAFNLVKASLTWETSGKPNMEEEESSDKPQTGAHPLTTAKGKDAKQVQHGHDSGSVKTLHEGAGAPFHFDELNLAISRHELLAIVGSVGCGKSSLLAALAGEMRMTSGTIAQGAKLAYCPQYAWIQNASVRENIVFGREFDQRWYDRVIEACALKPDLEVLPNGDRTELGERGITVSGGQKQRLNIARAIYSDAKIVLLDDPLSAVDAHVGRHIFEEAICGLLKGKCRVLATHQLHVLSQCDRIVWMQNGKIAAIDTFNALMATNKDFVQMLSMTADEKKSVEPGSGSEASKTDEVETEQDSENETLLKKIRSRALSTSDQPGLMTEEDKAEKGIKGAVWLAYIKATGSVLVAPTVIVMVCLAQTSQVMGTFWLSYWTSGKFGLSQGTYMGVYAALGFAQAMLMFVFAMALTLGGTEASKNMMQRAMKRTLNAPMAFFDTTPLGRIMNRFSKDVDVMDNFITDSMRMYFLTLATVISIFVLIIVYFPYFAAVLVPLSVLFYFAAAFYRASAREIKRHEAVLRSFVFSRFGEALAGNATIRAYGVQERYRKELDKAIDNMDAAYFLTFSNQGWLSVRLDLIGNLLALTTALLVVTNRFSVNPSTEAVILSYVLQVVGMMQFMIKQLAEVENSMNSTERIYNYGSELPMEEDPTKAHLLIKPAPSWPEHGNIKFDTVQMRYRPGLPLVLKGLNLSISGGERIGVVGRTGAGKSSIMACLFRMIELSSGKIEIDGVDISKISLHDVRSKLSIIPQDPTLFRGTVRSNLDPFGQYSDLELWRALRQSCLLGDESEPISSATTTPTMDEKAPSSSSSHSYTNRVTLDTPVLEEGLNFSLGQRQLLALARAMVRQSRIIICDEATSSIDEETDRKIQRTMQAGFAGSTVLCIAHRIRTIVKYDRIVVLDQGCVIECDSPLALWKIGEEGVFRGICEKAGIRREDFEV